MIRPPPRSTRTDTLFPYTTLFRSSAAPVALPRLPRGARRKFRKSPIIPSHLIALTAPVAPCLSLLRNARPAPLQDRSEEHTSELQSLMRISYAVFCLKKKTTKTQLHNTFTHYQTMTKTTQKN